MSIIKNSDNMELLIVTSRGGEKNLCVSNEIWQNAAFIMLHLNTFYYWQIGYDFSYGS